MKRTGERGQKWEKGAGKEGGGGAKVNDREEEIKLKKRKECAILDTVKSLFPIQFLLTPGLFLGACEQWDRGYECRTGSPDSSTRLALQFAFIKHASCELFCMRSTGGIVNRKFQGSVAIRVCPSFFIMKNSGK